MVERMGDNILIRLLTGTWLIRRCRDTGYWNLYYWSRVTDGWYSAAVGDYDWRVVYKIFMGRPL